jgi:2'-5' RNA ligase
MTNMPDGGLIALVCYLPEPLTQTLQDFREVLRSSYSALPHITVLPPRPMRGGIESVSRYIAETIAPYPEFAVELTEMLSFPATNVIYLAVNSGADMLRELHLALNSGELSYREAHEFTPHVTVAGPFDSTALPELLEHVKDLWRDSESPRSFPVRELVLLWTAREGDRWEPLRIFILGGKTKEFLATAANRT